MFIRISPSAPFSALLFGALLGTLVLGLQARHDRQTMATAAAVDADPVTPRAVTDGTPASKANPYGESGTDTVDAIDTQARIETHIAAA